LGYNGINRTTKLLDKSKFGGEYFMFYNAKEQLLEIQGVQMNYITFGKGTKPLILIQGLSTRSIKGAAFSLAYMYRIFAKDYKIYMFDRREDISDNITVRDLAADIAVAMDTLMITNADVFGVSQGGMIAQYLAIDRPDLVNQLVLAVTLSKNNETVERTVNDWIQITEQNNMKKLITDMAEKMYSDIYVKRYKPFMSLLTVFQKPKNVPKFIVLAKACLSCKAYDELDRIQCPVFVIGGMQDKVVSGSASLEISKKLGCEIFMYDNLGHAAYEEAKDFNQRVYNFLQHK
jgi:pimeloyl-ACP methyl ester carboxylesterase